MHLQVHEGEKTDLLEDTSKEWKKERIPVADLWIPNLTFDFEESVKFGEELSFSLGCVWQTMSR